MLETPSKLGTTLEHLQSETNEAMFFELLIFKARSTYQKQHIEQQRKISVSSPRVQCLRNHENRWWAEPETYSTHPLCVRPSDLSRNFRRVPGNARSRTDANAKHWKCNTGHSDVSHSFSCAACDGGCCEKCHAKHNSNQSEKKYLSRSDFFLNIDAEIEVSVRNDSRPAHKMKQSIRAWWLLMYSMRHFAIKTKWNQLLNDL